MALNDKAQHALGGVLVALVVPALAWLWGRWGMPAAMVAAALALGLGFEAVQRLRREGEPDVTDALATAGGGLLVALLAHALRGVAW